VKFLVLVITLFLTLMGDASAAIKPLPGTFELACRQLRIKTSGERSTIYFRTTADMVNIKSAIEKYKAGFPVPKGFQPFFDLSWSKAAKRMETECVQVTGDTGDGFSGRYLLRIITMQNNYAKYYDGSIGGDSLDDILYESVK
jgi:hypothetical protein